MVAIRIELTDEQARKLGRLAERMGLSVEDLARAGVQQSLLTEDEEFMRAARYVLDKNKELYRRLA